MFKKVIKLFDAALFFKKCETITSEGSLPDVKYSSYTSFTVYSYVTHRNYRRYLTIRSNNKGIEWQNKKEKY